MIGTKLAHYEITSHPGSGGMRDVDQATDTKPGRRAAIRMLPATCAGDAERLARVECEAKTLASLNHPNLAAIYGIDSNPLIMELVEGEDLSAPISRGPISIGDALPIAKQICRGA